MERYRSGHNGADSKSVCEQSHMGSNPILSAKKSSKLKGFLDFSFFSARCWSCGKCGKSSSFSAVFCTFVRTGNVRKALYIKAFRDCLDFLQELCLPALTFGVRKRKNIVHNIRGSDLGFVVQMAVNIRRCTDITVTEPFLYLLHRNIVCKKQWCTAVPLRYNYDKPEKPRRIKGFEVFSLVFSSFSKPKNHTEISRIIGGVSLTTNE